VTCYSKPVLVFLMEQCLSLYIWTTGFWKFITKNVNMRFPC